LSAVGVPLGAAKVTVELLLFATSFALQRAFVFVSQGPSVKPHAGKTDWSRYYSSRGVVPLVTRSFTWRKLRANIAATTLPPPFVVTELGGADSSFYAKVVEEFRVSRYNVVDNNHTGLDIFAQRCRSRIGVDLFLCNADVRQELPTTSSDGRPVDLCFSVGLIEHFDEAETAAVIGTHFALVRDGGWVLLTFPHPTWIYRILRSAMELLGIWRFPDERPLLFEEVTRNCLRFGSVVRQEINWGCGLTQGIVLARKRASSP
jgi:hypothetical protein